MEHLLEAAKAMNAVHTEQVGHDAGEDNSSNLGTQVLTSEDQLDDAQASTHNTENPWHRDYKPKHCGLFPATVRDKVYTFLYSSSTTQLIEMARKTKSKQAGPKNTLICYLLLNA